MRILRIILVISLLLIAAGFMGCSKKNASSTNKPSSSKMQQIVSKPAEQPIAPEKNPPGDIPDTQAFVKYSSSQGGYELEVPEGWARTETGMDVTFTEKLDGLSVKITNTTPPTTQSIRTDQMKQLEQTGRAVTIKSIKDVKLANGPAVRMVYESNSEPNPVTSKQVRLENDNYFYYKGGRMAELRLWAPVGADNVDQWNRISNSFRLR
ncbi:hypothetical protein BMS3Abin09_00134 [bacterium BMS3Abin09]|nr:hypothetical protein BMS3Abin09_00134 [bacterium BMS3Abin09]